MTGLVVSGQGENDAAMEDEGARGGQGWRFETGSADGLIQGAQSFAWLGSSASLVSSADRTNNALSMFYGSCERPYPARAKPCLVFPARVCTGPVVVLWAWASLLGVAPAQSPSHAGTARNDKQAFV